ncbi:MAG: peptide-methionine (S)-S-oxide reductase MsrA [Nitrospirota bacterium]
MDTTAERKETDMPQKKLEKATFAGGCFWCMESPFDKLRGVISTTVGYTGGHTENPTYEEVSTGTTGHAEAIEIVYDPAQVPYTELLDAFWKLIDPTTRNQQFADRGSQYRTAIFYHNEEQRRLAEASKERLEKSGKFNRPIVTEIVPASKFYPAEEYHQDYYRKNPFQYKMYLSGSGREEFIFRTWGKDAAK